MNEAHRYSFETLDKHSTHDGTWRTHEIFLREAESRADTRRLAAHRDGADGETPRKDTDERPLLHKTRLRRRGKFFEEVLVLVKPREV